MVNDLIVVIDVNDVDRMIFRNILHPYGVTVLECSNVSDAMHLLRIHHAKCVFIEETLINLEGGFLKKEIERFSKYSKIHSIGYTLNAMHDRDSYFNPLNVDDFLVGPIEVNNLLKVIR
jgi:CheY-like chemotaxis protein